MTQPSSHDGADTPRQAVPLAKDLRAVLPIGIPLGCQPQPPGDARRFAVRRGGRFCSLDVEGQDLWISAWRGLPRQELAHLMADKWKRDVPEVLKDIDHFIAGRLLLQLGGDWREDWERITTIRPVPRAFIKDYDGKFRFRLVTPGGRWEIWLSPDHYAVWSAWDGAVTLGEAVRSAAEASGWCENVLQQRAHSLLVVSVRAAAIFMDELALGGNRH